MDESKSEPNKNKTEDQEKQVPSSIKSFQKTENRSHAYHDCQHKQSIPWPQRIEAACAVLLVFITGTYTFFAGQQWCIMRDTFNAANKPSVGLNGYAVLHLGFDKGGRLITSRDRTPETDRMSITAEIKNFGTVAAEDFEAYWDGYLDGVKQPREKRETPPRTIFPGRLIYLNGGTGIKMYPDIVSGKSILEMQLTVRYKGPSQSYAYCEIDRYAPVNNAFMDVGSCPVTEP